MWLITAGEADEREARTERMIAQARNVIAGHDKLAAESSKLVRDRDLGPWQIALSAMTAGRCCSVQALR